MYSSFFCQAILGGTIQVPTLTGDVVVKVSNYFLQFLNFACWKRTISKTLDSSGQRDVEL